MIPRTLFKPEHETFRDSVRRFMETEVAPHDDQWQEQGYVDRAVWKKAGDNGFLCCSMPEDVGGAAADKLYSIILIEEQARINNSSLGMVRQCRVYKAQPLGAIGDLCGLAQVGLLAQHHKQLLAIPAGVAAGEV